MRDYQRELDARAAFIRNALQQSGAAGIVFGNSGGKDSALAGILAKHACEDTLGLIMPCQSLQNFGSDLEDGKALAAQYGIETRTLDLTAAKQAMVQALERTTQLNAAALSNIAPRLRMSALYAVAAAENRLVMGTGNRSEVYMGYFTKWGDGAYDLNPIADLTVTEIYEFLRFLGAPQSIIEKAPSAGLFEGQTDEQEMGVRYQSIDAYLLTGDTDAQSKCIIDRFHEKSAHKRRMPAVFKGEEA